PCVHEPRRGGMGRVQASVARADRTGASGQRGDRFAMIDTTAVIGYAWPLIVSPGETVAFHLSSETLPGAEARIVRVRCADPDPDGPGLKLTAPGTEADGPVALRRQALHPGSYAAVPDAPELAALRAFTTGAFVWPTRPGAGPQTVLA